MNAHDFTTPIKMRLLEKLAEITQGEGAKKPLEFEACVEAGGVGGGGEELRAGEDEVAFAGSFLGSRRQWPSSSSVFRKLVCSQDTASGSRRWSRRAAAAGPASGCVGPRPLIAAWYWA